MKPSINAARNYFQNCSLPRLTNDIAAEREYFNRKGYYKPIFRRVLPTDRERGKLYPLLGDGTKLLSHFGIGIGMYFVQLLFLGILLFLAGLIMIYGVISYAPSRFGITSSSSFLSLTAACPDLISVLADTCSDISTCDAVYRPNCEIPYNVILADIIMCSFLTVTLFLSKYCELKYEERLDEAIQSSQDYSIEVTDPDPDATDPDEWYKFFSRFGKVVYITVCKKNRKLGEALIDRYVIKQFINELEQHQPISSITSTMTSLFYRKKDLNYWQNQLSIIDNKLSTMYLDKYLTCRVFVTFEYEEHQRLALNELEVPDIDAFLDNKSKINYRHLFRGKNVLDIKESPEPDAIIWKNLEQSNISRFMNRVCSRCLTIGMLIACYFAVQIGEKTSTIALSVIIVFIDALLAYIFDYITELEGPQDEGSFQESLQLKLFSIRILLSTVFPFINLSYRHILDKAIITKILSVQLSTCFSDLVLNLLDIKGIITKYLTGPWLSKNQFELNSHWSRTGNWNVADRYTVVSKIIFICIFYSLLNPLILFFGSISLICISIVDRYSLLRRWEKPCMMDASISSNLRKQCLLAVAAHMVVSIRWIYSWPMDNVYQTFNSITNTYTYKKVDKFPNYFILDLKSKYWQSDNQKKLLTVYLIITIVVIIINLHIWLISGLIQRLYKLFYKSKQLVGDSRSVQFSELSNIFAYVPTISKENGKSAGYKFLFADTSLMLNKHIIPIHNIGSDVPDLSIDIPNRYRKHILSNVKWYGDEPLDKEINKYDQVIQQFLNDNNKKELTINMNMSLNRSNTNLSIRNEDQLMNSLDQAIQSVVKNNKSFKIDNTKSFDKSLDSQLDIKIDVKPSIQTNELLQANSVTLYHNIPYTYEEKNILRKMRQIVLTTKPKETNAIEKVDFSNFYNNLKVIFPHIISNQLDSKSDRNTRIILRHIYAKAIKQQQQVDGTIYWHLWIEFIKSGRF